MSISEKQILIKGFLICFVSGLFLFFFFFWTFMCRKSLSVKVEKYATCPHGGSAVRLSCLILAKDNLNICHGLLCIPSCLAVC